MSCTRFASRGAQVVYEGRRVLAVTAAGEPGDDKLCLSVQGRPGPDVARILRSGLGGRDVPLLRVAETPHLIDLDAPTAQVLHALVVERGARRAGVHEQLGHGVDRNVSDARDGAE